MDMPADSLDQFTGSSRIIERNVIGNGVFAPAWLQVPCALSDTIRIFALTHGWQRLTREVVT